MTRRKPSATTSTEQLQNAFEAIVELLLELHDDAKAGRVIGAVAVLYGLAEVVWKEPVR